MENIAVSIMNKFIPGLSLLLRGEYRRFFALWGFIYAAFFTFWFLICLIGGSKSLCWFYVVVVLSASIIAGMLESKNGTEPSFKLDWIKKVLAFLLVISSAIMISKANLGVQYRAVSPSMAPTLQIGDNFITDPFSIKYFGHEIQRKDIVVHKKPGDDKTLFVHRILGIPGDSVRIIKGDIYLNGSKVGEKRYEINPVWKSSRCETLDMMKDRCAKGFIPAEYCALIQSELKMLSDTVSWKLSTGQYFLVGDNIMNSSDSRHYGVIEKERITAKVVCFGIALNGSGLGSFKKMGARIE